MKNPILDADQLKEMLLFYNDIKNGNNHKCPPWKTSCHCNISNLIYSTYKADCVDYFPKMLEIYKEGLGYLHKGECPCTLYSKKYLLKRLREIIKANNGPEKVST